MPPAATPGARGAPSCTPLALPVEGGGWVSGLWSTAAKKPSVSCMWGRMHTNLAVAAATAGASASQVDQLSLWDL
jgi:hypothetical protein